MFGTIGSGFCSDQQNRQDSYRSQYIPLLKTSGAPKCVPDEVCYVEDTDVCPIDYVYTYHPFYKESCFVICTENKKIKIKKKGMKVLDGAPDPCYCKNGWKYETITSAIIKTCEVE